VPTTAGDARVSRTRAALVAAVEDVLEQGSWSDLTIGGLCTRAGISRPTFYQHFSSPEDLLGTTIRHRLDQARAGACDPRDKPQVLAAALTRLDDERAEYACLAEHPTVYAQVLAAFQEWLAERIREEFPEAGDITVSYVVGGIAGVMGRWLATTTDRPSPDELARTLWTLNRTVLEMPD
jgi:AcrR family transcriptional regulator